MVYVSLGDNSTGQKIVGCVHIYAYNLVDMFELPDGSAIYHVYTPSQPVFFKPSKQTIVIWCRACYEAMGKLERKIS